MSWREAISAGLPDPPGDAGLDPSGGRGGGDLRRDILDELSDHLDCAMRRETMRHPDIDDAAARSNVLKRFGDPRAIARKLWLDAMKERIMHQRILIGTNILLAAVVVAMFIIGLVAIRQNQQFQASLVERLAAVAATPAAAPPASGAEAAALSWPTARVRVEGGNAPFELRFSGELYNPGERINLNRTVEADGETVFGPMRPGRYTLTVSDAHGARMARSVVVPPGGEHRVRINAPDWQPGPTRTRITVDLPDDLAEHGPVFVLELNPALAAAGNWAGERAFAMVTSDARAKRYDANPLHSNEVPRAISRAVAGLQPAYRFDPDELGLGVDVELDPSFNYTTPSSITVLIRHGEDEEPNYRSIWLSESVTISANAVASGEASISLSEAAIQQLRSAIERPSAPRSPGGVGGGGGRVPSPRG